VAQAAVAAAAIATMGADAAATAAAGAAGASGDSATLPPSPQERRANELKDEANQFFKAGHYEQAIAVYTEAIQACPSAVLYSNRAMAYLKTEAFGCATEDAKKAIELDPTYVKGYYRLGSAHGKSVVACAKVCGVPR